MTTGMLNLVIHAKFSEPKVANRERYAKFTDPICKMK